MFKHEAQLSKSTPPLQPGAIVTLLQKGLLYMFIEAHTNRVKIIRILPINIL